MAPRLIEVICPSCKGVNKSIPADMGDKTIKCCECGKFVRYKHRTGTFEIVSRPEKEESSGLTFC